VPLVGIVTLLAGCGSDSLANRTQLTRIDTLPSGTIAISNSEQGTWTAEGGWRLVEELRVGAPGGPEEATFGRIGGIEVDDLDRIWIIDLQARVIRIFDGAGRYVRTVGRQGSGPGEFSRPVAIHRHPDGNMWVIDPGVQRYSVFDTSGMLLATHQRHVSPSLPQRSEGFGANGMLMELAGIFDNGVFSTRLLSVGKDGVPQDTSGASPPCQCRLLNETRLSQALMASVKWEPVSTRRAFHRRSRHSRRSFWMIWGTCGCSR
jgi:hypothetical protein